MEITVSCVREFRRISFNIPVRYPREQCCFQHATTDVLVDFYVGNSKMKVVVFVIFVNDFHNFSWNTLDEFAGF